MNLNYADVAKNSGLSLSTVKRFFSAKGNPTLATTIKIAKVFNISLDAVNSLRKQIIAKH